MHWDLDDGLTVSSQTVTVAQAVTDWLEFGLTGLSASTIEKYGYLCRGHIIPDLGTRKLPDLSARDVDRWLAAKAEILATSTLARLKECLNRAVNRAMARDLGKRNVVALCGVPKGQEGRPSKSLTLDQAATLLDAARSSRLHGDLVLSLLTGARTEELRALTWDRVGQPDADPPVPPSVQVWRSVREHGDTKTRKSRRTLGLPTRAVAALREHRVSQDAARDRTGALWKESSLVFTTRFGTPLDAGNVRRGMRAVLRRAGLEDIADLVGHAGTRVTEAVYPHQLRPVLLSGASAMDRIFGQREAGSEG